MNSTLKVLVCSASPDRVNSNAVLRHFVGRGFAEELSEKQVFSCSFDYAVEAAKLHRPELVLVFGSCMPASCNYTGLRNYCVRSSAVLVFWLHDDPYEFDFNYKIYQYADFIFSNDKWAVTHIDHPRVFHLPLAADPLTHYRSLRNEFDRDFFFCGVGFQNRRDFMIDSTDTLLQFKVEVFGSEWPTALSFCHNSRIANELLPDYYAGSIATLNIGRRYNLANDKYQLDATTPGPRTFEAAMAGTVQFVYYECPEIEDYFSINEEVIIFDTDKELIDMMTCLKHDPGLRTSIASAAQKRVNAEHTYKMRASTIISKIERF